MASDFNAVISFNVGGQLFTTFRETLLKDGNSRLALIARGLLGTARDPVNGACLLDRDPTYFQTILNWLRDGWCRLPKAAEERRELLQEIRYYQLTGFEGWLRTQEILAEAGAPQAQELLVESPRPPVQPGGPHQLPPPPQRTGSPRTYEGYPAYQGYPSPSSGQPVPGPSSPHAAFATGTLAMGRGTTPPAWASPAVALAVPGGQVSASSTGFLGSAVGPNTLTGSVMAAASSQPFQGHHHHSPHLHTYTHIGPQHPPTNTIQHQQALPGQHLNHQPQPPRQAQTMYQSTSAMPAYGSPTRTSPVRTSGGARGAGWAGGSDGPTSGVPGLSNGTGSGGSGVAGGAGGAIASLREAFLAATSPQRPAQHVGPYSLTTTGDDTGSWTSKYLKGNDALRELVNTLLELAFLAPHRVLHSGKSHVSVSVACSHGQEASLVGSKDDHMRSKLLEVRVRGALGWTFELTLRPSSDVALWDKYGGVAAAVQDNWFVLGAILKDQFGVVLEEDSAARPVCAACRRTCLAITLNKIY